MHDHLHLPEGGYCCMTIYINGHKASKADIALLVSNCKNGIEVITDVHITPRGWLSVSTM